MSRIDSIRLIAERTPESASLVATTGMPARELFAVNDSPQNLYLMGSLGHAMAVGLGIATEKPQHKVVVIDGDGSVIMHMGSLSTIGFYQPKNLIHVVLDNEAYETTGNQDTTSTTTDLAAIARDCNYVETLKCSTAEELTQAYEHALNNPGPILIHVKINREPATGIPRITTKHSAADISANYLRYLNEQS